MHRPIFAAASAVAFACVLNAAALGARPEPAAAAAAAAPSANRQLVTSGQNNPDDEEVEAFGQGSVPVYRFYSPTSKTHFYTISEGEKNNLARSGSGWNFEGVAYYAYTTRQEGTVPLYRFFSLANNAHFFTRSEAERDSLVSSPAWRFEGTAYYVYASDDWGRIPVYRFWSSKFRHHFFTTSPVERSNLILNQDWDYNGVAFYAIPATHTVVFEREGGTGGTSSVNVSYGGALPQITPPSRTGFVFEGYYSWPGGNGTKYYNANGTAARAWDRHFTAGLYAAWRVPSPSLTAALKPVYRLFSLTTGRHFFTINEGEKNSLVASGTWRYEGVAYYAYATYAFGSTPLYRFYSSAGKAHFFTPSEAEKNSLLGSPTWRFEGIAFYVSQGAQAGTTPIYRFWSLSKNYHFFTANAGERDSLRANAGWRFENVGFHAWTRDPRAGVSLPQALNAPDLAFSTGGAAPWRVVVQEDGEPAAATGGLANGQASWVRLDVSGGGVLSFWWQVSSEEGYDCLSCSVDGREVARISGEDEGLVTYRVPFGGNHSVVWTYAKDEARAEGQDLALLDFVGWNPDGAVGDDWDDIVLPDVPLDEALDAEGLDFSTGGDRPWQAVSGLQKEGEHAAGTSGLADGQESWVSLSVSGGGVLTFWWQVSGEEGFDFLSCSVDGREIAAISGEDEGYVTYHVPDGGDHEVVWTYAKDIDGASGMDFAVLDGVGWRPDAAAGDAWGYLVGEGEAIVMAYAAATGSVSVPESLGGLAVVGIGDCAFAGCGGLTTLVIPSSVSSVGWMAFADCNALSTLKVPSALADEANSGYWDSYFDEDLGTDVEYWYHPWGLSCDCEIVAY